MSVRALMWATAQVAGDDKAKSCLLWLAWHHNEETGLCCPSIATLMREMEVASPATVRGAIKRLCDRGFVSFAREFSATGAISRTVYSLPLPQRMTDPPPSVNDRPLPQQMEEGGSNAVAPLPQQMTPKEKDKSKEKEKGKVTAHPPHLFDLDLLPDSWRQYCTQVAPQLDPDRTFAIFRGYWADGKGSSTRRSDKGWTATWQTWVRREADKPQRPQHQPSAWSPPQGDLVMTDPERDAWNRYILDAQHSGYDRVKWARLAIQRFPGGALEQKARSILHKAGAEA